MKKGFTLIELLAVILILGIIALIAIPVVTKVIDQANMSSFKETNQNIASAVENSCSKASLTGNAISSGYSFSSDGASSKIDVKGKLPTGGSVATDSSCKSSLYTTNNKYCAVKTVDSDEVEVGKLVNGSCSIVTKDDSYCTKDTNPGVLEGTGTSSDPYLINSIEDLMGLNQQLSSDDTHFAGKYVKLNINIDFKNSCSYADSNNTTYGDINGDGKVEGLMTELTTGAGFMPLASGNEYSGNFDGGNHYIFNLYINRPETYNVGLFSEFYSNQSTQEIKNINMVNANVTGNSLVSLVIGEVYGSQNSFVMKNINVSGNLTAGSKAGLIIGENYVNDSDVSDLVSLGSVNGTSSYIGGTIGYVNGGTYNNISNYATVNNTGSYTGGTFGKLDDVATASNLKNYGNVAGKYAVGGIVGYDEFSDNLLNAYNYADITGHLDVGGIAGSADTPDGGKNDKLYNYGDISYTNEGYSSGDQASEIAGIFGQVDSRGGLTNSYNYGNITGMLETGGIMGYGGLTSDNVYNYGKVIGTSSVGGIAGGYSNNPVTNVYNYAEVIGERYVGGIIGYGYITTINNLNNYGTIKTTNYGQDDPQQAFIGGLIGIVYYTYSVTATNLYNYADIYGYYDTAGLIGSVDTITGNNFANYGKIYGHYQIGGLIGNVSTASLNNVLNKADIAIASFQTSSYNPLGGGLIGNGSTVTLNNAYSIGNINVESNNGYWARVGGLLGTVNTANISNVYVVSNLSVNNTSSEEKGYIGGVIANSNSTSTLTNVYYKGKITTNLTNPYAATMVADENQTLVNAYYNNAFASSFTILSGTAVDNSLVNTTWFNTTLNLCNAFSYTNGIYPELYQNGTTNLITNQKNINY